MTENGDMSKRQWRAVEIISALAAAGVFAWALAINGMVTALEAKVESNFGTLSREIQRERQISAERHRELLKEIRELREGRRD